MPNAPWWGEIFVSNPLPNPHFSLVSRSQTFSSFTLGQEEKGLVNIVLYKTIRSTEDCEALQADLDSVCDWCNSGK